MENSRFKWTRAVVLNSCGHSASQINLREPFEVVLQGVANTSVQNMEICFAAYSALGFGLFNSCQRDSQVTSDYPPGTISFHVKFDPNLFGPGNYWLDLYATAPGALDYIHTAVVFSVASVNPATGSCVRANFGCGVVLYPCTWSVQVKDMEHAVEQQQCGKEQTLCLT